MINKAGVDLIKEFEGCRLEAYLDLVGRPTIGYGSTRGVTMGMKITQEEADKRLEDDIAEPCLRVDNLLGSAKNNLNENQYAALVCFTFNLGSGALSKSTLLNCIKKSQLKDASAEFEKWCKAGGVIVPGLLRRRQAERALFEAPVT